MRFLLTVSAFMFALWLFSPGCSQKQNHTHRRADRGTFEVEAVKTNLQQEKREFVEEVEADLETLDRRIRSLRAKLEKQAGETEQELKRRWNRLSNEREKLQKDLDELKARTGSKWKELTEEVNAQLRTLNDSLGVLNNRLGLG